MTNPNKKSILVIMEGSLVDRLTEMASDNLRSRNAQIVTCLREAADAYEKGKIAA